MKNQSARMSGNSPSDLATLEGGLNRSASTTPEALIPSRIAARSTMYATQSDSSVPAAHIAKINTPAPTIASINSPPEGSLYQPSGLSFETEAEAIALALSLQRHTDRNGEVSYRPGTPPAENSNPSGASEGADGQGVCTTASNLDKTRSRIVRKGCLCDWGGLRVRVQRVRLGIAYAETLYQKNQVVADCASLRVLHG